MSLKPVGNVALALDLGVTLRDVGVPAALELDEETRRDGKPAQPDVAAVGDGFEAREHLVRQRLEPAGSRSRRTAGSR